MELCAEHMKFTRRLVGRKAYTAQHARPAEVTLKDTFQDTNLQAKACSICTLASHPHFVNSHIQNGLWRPVMSMMFFSGPQDYSNPTPFITAGSDWRPELTHEWFLLLPFFCFGFWCSHHVSHTHLKSIFLPHLLNAKISSVSHNAQI